MKSALIAVLLFAISAHAATVDNDDSCDISVLPAATLLLPYFEVDLDHPGRATTLFTITNVTHHDRIARVTLWTDRAYPVLTFNVFLTGYDVQSVNLFDVIARGGIPIGQKRRGDYSDVNVSLDFTRCAAAPLDALAVARLRKALTLGDAGECANVGGVHANAIGYATIDVVGNCSSRTPADERYWTEDLRYDNVLIGDYYQIDSAPGGAQGGPLVHIRAVPEGGRPEGSTPATRAFFAFNAGFPRTFYSRYQPASAPMLDGRQPLPSAFAARWTAGTSLKIWRETRAAAACADYGPDLRVTELVMFDENANAVSGRRIALPATSRTPIVGAAPGWVYLNLDNSRADALTSQNWVISSTITNGNTVDVPAIPLGNGCSAAPPTSALTASGGPPIAPAPNVNPAGARVTTNNDDSCDIALLPAATLLLPYFEVDLANAGGDTTRFTVTNVSPHAQTARVTLWTDGAYPVLSFNLALAPYDLQTVDLFQVVARGRIEARDCTAARRTLPPETLARVHAAFLDGTVPGGCKTVGTDHQNHYDAPIAVGYATIDVVANCSGHLPLDPEYWTNDLAYDNVLIGDVEQVSRGRAQRTTMVHIRAVPEGGTFATRTAAPFDHTFYGRHQPASAPRRDGRQPLPSVFASQWIQNVPFGAQTILRIWREGVYSDASCDGYLANTEMRYYEVVRFDEAENAVSAFSFSFNDPLFVDPPLPATSKNTLTDRDLFPQMANGAIAGWVYLNLRDTDEDRDDGSNWVVATMSTDRYAVEHDAAALGNGCSLVVGPSEVWSSGGFEIIGPAENHRWP